MKSTYSKAIGAALATMLSTAPVLADNFNFRIGSGHPKGPAPYVTTMSEFFAVEVKARVEAQTDHSVNFIEAYGGSIAGVAETLESVQSGILDFGGYCICFEPSKTILA